MLPYYVYVLVLVDTCYSYTSLLLKTTSQTTGAKAFSLSRGQFIVTSILYEVYLQ